MLHFIIIYLLLMLLLIFICKLVLQNKNFNFVNKYPLGNYINKFLTKYISIWQTSGNIWIFFILTCVIISNIASILSLSHLITILK